MTILVMGATRNVRSCETDLLTARKKPVRVLVRDPGKVDRLPPTKERAIVDLEDPETLTEASDRCGDTTKGRSRRRNRDQVRTSSVDVEANG
jgi:uncharacterized protein YbjT (DUF2867 family)